MGNIFACIIRSQVNALDIGSLSHNYVKRCASCGSRQYTSSTNCRFCGGRVYEVSDAAAATASSGAAGRRRAAHNANVLSSQANGAHSSIPVILAHDPETDQIIRYVQDYRGQLVRISGPSPEGFRMRSDHPDYLISNSGRIERGDEDDDQKVIDAEKLRDELDLLPKTLDINTAQRADSLDELGRILASLTSSVSLSVRADTTTSGLRLRSLGSGRVTDGVGTKVELSEADRVEGSAGLSVGCSSTCSEDYSGEDTRQDLDRAIDNAHQLVTCPVCLSEYCDSLSLPCGHSFCLMHIGDIATESSPSCPMCREAIPGVVITIGRIMKGSVTIAGKDNETQNRSRGRGIIEATDTQGRRVIVIPSAGLGFKDSTETYEESIQSLPKDVLESLRNDDLEESVRTFRRLAEEASGLTSKSDANDDEMVSPRAKGSTSSCRFMPQGARKRNKMKTKTS